MQTLDPHLTADEQAAFWFLRLQDEDVAVEEIEEALTWKDRSPENQAAWARVETVWRDAGRLPATPFSRYRAFDRQRMARVGTIAAAAAIGTTALLSWKATPPRSIPPATIAMTDAPAAPAALADQVHPEDGYHFASRVGENRTIALDDGSEVVLGGASIISVSYSPEVRRIDLLSGEAFFHVAKDAARPFIVDAGDGETRAVGTQFDVRRGVDAVTVTVVEGVIRVSSRAPVSADATQPAQLAAGHQVSYSPKGSLGPVKPVSVEHATSWREGELTFVDRSLADVVIDLNRYSARPIQIDDDAIRSIRITGMVTVAKMDDWLHALEKDMPIQLVPTKDALLLAKKITASKD